jgi:hypothetical protein
MDIDSVFIHIMRHPEIQPDRHIPWLVNILPTELLVRYPPFEKWTPSVIGNVKGIINNSTDESQRRASIKLLVEFITFIVQIETIPESCTSVAIREVFINYC